MNFGYSYHLNVGASSGKLSISHLAKSSMAMAKPAARSSEQFLMSDSESGVSIVCWTATSWWYVAIEYIGVFVCSSTGRKCEYFFGMCDKDYSLPCECFCTYRNK